MNCVVPEKIVIGSILIQRLTDAVVPNVSKQSTQWSALQSSSQLVPNHILLTICEEKYCVAISRKIRNCDSVVDHYVFSAAVE